MKESKLENEINILISDATSFRETQRDKEYIVNRAHYEGLQWNLAENKTDSPFLLRSDINHLKNAVDLRLGSLCAEKYSGELKPLSPNDIDNINNLNIVYKNEWNRLKLDELTESALKDAAICDNGYIQLNVDTSKIIGGTGTRRQGVITAIKLDTSNVYLDPNASNIDDCEYYVVKIRKSENWVKSNKPDWLETFKKYNIKPGIVNDKTEGQIYTGRDYEVGQDKLYEINTVYRKEPVSVTVTVTDESGNSSKEKVNRIAIREYIMVSKHLIETNKNYPFEDFSIIPIQWEAEPQSPYGIPLLRGLTVPQKVANLIESAANNIAMHYTVPTWLVSAESGIDIDKFAKLSNALGMAWKVNGDVSKAVKQMDPPQINADLIGIKESFVNNIRNYAGVNDVYIGNIGTAGSTAEGTNSAINRATVIDNAIIGQIEKFVEKASRLLVKFIARYYKNEIIYVRDTEKNNVIASDFKSITVGEAFENLNYDFYVDLASRSKNDKNRQYNLIKEIYTIQNQYKEDKRVVNVTDLVKAAQLDNYNEMFKRFSDMSEEAFAEKADLIVQIMNIGQTMTPNGQPLITAEEMQQGIMDVLDDNGSLASVEQIFKTYEDYQTQITQLKNEMQNQQNQMELTNLQNESQLLEQQMQQGAQQMRENASQQNNLNGALDLLGL